ncbi:DUF4348 domain-containing protein [Pontibacter sp. KCTC 32443]|uniref:DUF4348 domain-containing protein n=1 Tax=Pontibacter TaxID=323449 RepID=UPI00164E074B|nr:MULTISPECIES: DUF4348 domain-containing protein [Pontibacter]MBC5772861.1 DUF4348 domain-containing protein [Pontibacter sp. KCTC 32443]
MKLLCLVIMLFSVGCDNTRVANDITKNIAKENTSSRFSKSDAVDVGNIEEEKTNNEYFDSFFLKFSSDSVFQLSRVEFPYKITLMEDIGSVTRYISKEDWLFINFSQMQVGEHHLEKKEESNSTVTMIYTLEDTGVYFTYVFNKNKGKWMLTSMEDSST